MRANHAELPAQLHYSRYQYWYVAGCRTLNRLRRTSRRGARRRERFTEADPPRDEQDILDGYRLTLSLLRVAVDAYVWGDRDKPIFVDLISTDRFVTTKAHSDR